MLQLVRVNGSSYRYHVVRADGLPDEPLTAFVEEQRHCLAGGSVSLYARELLAFLNWSESDPIAVRNGWTALGSSVQIRQLVRQYLTVAASCKIKRFEDHESECALPDLSLCTHIGCPNEYGRFLVGMQ
jgi:hypothetical protein